MVTDYCRLFFWKYTVCIHCLYTVCIRKPYLGYLCSCMRSVYEKKAGYSVYALYPHRQISFTPGVHRQISRNFAALPAQANLKSKLIEHAFTPNFRVTLKRTTQLTLSWLKADGLKLKKGPLEISIYPENGSSRKIIEILASSNSNGMEHTQ